jgi:polyisoprenoid-binding protein YceI
MIEHKSFLCGAIFSNLLVFLLVILVSANSVSAQQKLMVKKAEMAFTSNAELELISASSDKVQGLIDPATNQFAFTVDVKSFRGFNSELQREHFNEKYMESEKFPKARFSGKIIEPIDFLADQSYDVRAKGELDIHGQKQTRIIKSKVTVKDGMVHLETTFFVPLADHNISIPNIVNQKIATEIEVSFKATMSGQ